MSLLLNRTGLLAPQTTAPLHKAAFCQLPGTVRPRTLIWNVNQSVVAAGVQGGRLGVVSRAALVSGRLERSANGWKQQGAFGLEA